MSIVGYQDDGDRVEGCAYLEDGAGGPCGALCRLGSSYCPAHHALCHIRGGSPAERRLLRETEALAKAVGGRRGRPGRRPPDSFLRRLEQVTRASARAVCSCYVRSGETRR